MKTIFALASLFLLVGRLAAQADSQAPALATRPTAAQSDARSSNPNQMDDRETSNLVTLPAGTKVLLVMRNSVSSRNGKPGDGVYLESTFPVIAKGRVVIPAGTYVQGAITEVKRSGRVKGRAEMLLHFNTLIYPNGYTVELPGALESSDSNDTQQVKDKEGTVQAAGGKGKDAAAIATAAGTGGLIGGLATRTGKGAAIGGGLGAAVGIATALLTRGDEVRLESGSSVEMVFQRAVDLDLSRIDPNSRVVGTTPQRYRRLERPTAAPPTPSIGPIVR